MRDLLDRGTPIFSSRNLPIRTLIVATLALVASLLPAGAGAAEQKTYTADIRPNAVVAGTSTPFTLTLHNTSTQQQLGSANLTPPSGFTLDDSHPGVKDNVLQLRNLAIPPGGSAAIPFDAVAACGVTSGTFSILAKQANNFSGPPGNNLTLTGSPLTVSVEPCQATGLRFLTQPTDAKKNSAISSVVGDPAGAPIQVELLRGGQRLSTSTASVTMTLVGGHPDSILSGQVTRAAVAGVATFDDLKIDRDAGGYILEAGSGNVPSVASSPFRIWDEIVACRAGRSCGGQVQITNMHGRVDVTPSTNAGALLVSIGMDQLSCGDAFNHAPDVLTVDSVGLDGTKTVTITVAKVYDQLQANNGVTFYEVCFSGDEPFTDRNGVTIPADGSGLLPLCETGQPPCLQSRTKTKAGDVLLVVRLAPGDPKMG